MGADGNGFLKESRVSVRDVSVSCTGKESIHYSISV